MRCRSGEFRFRGVNLDQPGTYLHWSIFTISLANVVLIAVLVVIFRLALVLPFLKAAPTRRHQSCRPGPIQARSPAHVFR
jgi:hypothetical protein